MSILLMVSVFDAVVDKFKQDRFWILQLQMDCLDLVWRRSLSQVFCQIWVSLQIPSLCVLGVMELEELLLEIMALWTKTKLHSFYRSYSKWWMPLLFMMIQHNLLIFSPLNLCLQPDIQYQYNWGSCGKKPH